MDRALERVRPRAPLPLRLGDRVQRGARAVGQHDLQPEHVVDRGAVDDRLAPGGVVADHPADRRPVGGRRVRPEAEAVPVRGAVEVLLHDARLHPHAPRLRVEVADRVHVAGGVEDDPLAGGLAGEARARRRAGRPARRSARRPRSRPRRRRRRAGRRPPAGRARTCSRRSRTGGACRRRRARRRAARASARPRAHRRERLRAPRPGCPPACGSTVRPPPSAVLPRRPPGYAERQ